MLSLHYLEKYALKPRDALHCATMQENEIEAIASFDKDFDKVKEIKRIRI